jgi:NAD(P)-dependent dehydrogenase (short-subunit alcohol dehydrogenase family)
MVAFTASKAAVEHSVKSFAYEFGNDGIRINAIALSSLQTDTVKQSKPYADFENFMPVEKVAHHALIFSRNDLEFLNGETISLFKYSKSFFEQGYLTRNRQE